MNATVLQAFHDELEKIAGIGVNILALDRERKWNISAGIPYGLSIDRRFPGMKIGVGAIDITPFIGLGLLGPHIGPSFSWRKRKRKKKPMKKKPMKKKAAAFGEGSASRGGWSSPTGGFATEFRSVGMPSQKAQSTNLARLKAPGGFSNIPSAGVAKMPPLPGTGKLKVVGLGKALKVGGMGKSISMKPPSLPKPG